MEVQEGPIRAEHAEADRDYRRARDRGPWQSLSASCCRVLAFGVMSEKRLAIFAVSPLGFVAVVLVGFWLVLGLAD